MRNFEKEFDGFLKDMAVTNYSPLSILKYARCIRMFLDWANEKGITGLKRIGAEELKTYYEVMRQNPKFSAHYVGSNVNALKCFFRYLKKNNEVLYDFSVVLKVPRVTYQLPKDPLTQEEVKKMLEGPDLRSLLGMRNRAILETLYSCGIRVLEMANLTLLDVDLEKGYLFIREGKGRKDRVVPIGEHAVFFIKAYLEGVRPVLADKTEEAVKNNRLWLNRRGIPMVKQDIIFMVRYLRKKVGIKKQVTPHSFRRTLGVEMIRNGCDFLSVKEILGHSRSRTTLRYLSLSGVDLKEALEKCHPRYEADESEDVVPVIKSFRGDGDGRI